MRLPRRLFGLSVFMVMVAAATAQAGWSGPVGDGHDVTFVLGSGVSEKTLVYVGESASDTAAVVAVNAKTGQVRWSDDTARAGQFVKVAFKGARTYVLGSVNDDPDGGSNLWIRCYKTETGEFQWEREVEAPADPSHSLDVFAGNGGTIHIAGRNVVISGNDFASPQESVVRAFDARTGN